LLLIDPEHLETLVFRGALKRVSHAEARSAQRYERYERDSGDYVKKGWELKFLGDLFDITSSKRVFESEWKKQGVPFYRAREIVKLANNRFVNNELFISNEMFNQYSKKYGIPVEDDIMVTGVGTLGICYVVRSNDKFYFKDGNIIWLRKKSDVNSRFVEYAFKSDYLRAQIDNSNGATVGTYTIVKAKSTSIPIPSLSEQQRIVGILDEAFEGIEKAKVNAQRNLDNAREVFESYLNEVFTKRGEGWVEKTISHIGKVYDGPHATPHTVHDGPIFLGISALNDGEIDLSETRHVTMLDYNKWTKRIEPQENDIVFSYETRLGQVAIIPKGLKCCLGRRMGLIRLDLRIIDPEYFIHMYTSSMFQEYLENKTIRGTTVDRISIRDFPSFIIYMPNLEKQKDIACRIRLVKMAYIQLQSIYRRKLSALDELKQALLHRAFSGEL